MNTNDLFSAKTRKSLFLRENWMRQLFSNPRLKPIHKLVMTAFTFWYYAEHQEEGESVPMDFSAMAELIGMPEDETEQAMLDMVEAGVFSATDAQGHEMQVTTHYACNDCGHEWQEGETHEPAD